MRGDRGAPTRGEGVAGAVDDCHVVAACLDHEKAREALGEDGKVHGLLTGALMRSLADVPDRELATVPWRQIWQAVRADVETRNAQQHPWMAGNTGRAVLAGPPVKGDPGFSVHRDGDRYEIAAGTLAGVTRSAVIAVYGEEPEVFAAVDSPPDRRDRLGLLRVEQAQMSTAAAYAEGPPFSLPPGARGRIVATGEAPRLRCAILPPREDLVRAVAASPLLEVVAPAAAQVQLVQSGATWVLTDDVHGGDGDCGLCTLTPGQLHLARDVIEHYFYYAAPLRMAYSVNDTPGALPGALAFLVLSCQDELPPEIADTADLAEVRSPAGVSAYEVSEGAGICFEVHNRSTLQLRVAVLNAAASGRVQYLDDQSIDPGSSHRFWSDNEVGVPFEMTVPAGKHTAIDRLVAIGTTGNLDIKHLAKDLTFAEVIARLHYRDFKGRKKRPVERWTATQVIVKTRSAVR